MPRLQTELCEWTSVVSRKLPRLRNSQVRVLALYSYDHTVMAARSLRTKSSVLTRIRRPQTENTLLIDYGSGSQVVYRAGDNYYLYDSGMDGKARTSISLTLLNDGAAIIFWSVNSKDGNICSFPQDFQLPPELRPTATSTPEAQATPSSDSGTDPDADNTGDTGSAGDSQPAMPAGKYTVSWMSLPGA